MVAASLQLMTCSGVEVLRWCGVRQLLVARSCWLGLPRMMQVLQGSPGAVICLSHCLSKT
jgi:hypothetical protein